MPKYNGHKNWNHWNVSLWLNNDEGLYNAMRCCIKWKGQYGKEVAAKHMLEYLLNKGITHTPDGAPYTKTSIRAAMVGM